ncbi:hypothetical protein C0J52_12457 [Blattella germanica]|nr:hypothetical protein C0J52_12457 [Blattella germanica]
MPLLARRRAHKRKQEWVNEILARRDRYGEFSHLQGDLEMNVTQHFCYFRMKKETFQYILDEVKDHLQKFSSTSGKPFHPQNAWQSLYDKDNYTIQKKTKYLVTGLSFKALSMSYRISDVTVGRIIHETDISVPYVLVGDGGYPLKPYLMCPYPLRNLTQEQETFNKRLSHARQVVECAFGTISNKWRILMKAIEVTPERAENIVKCICLLHNIILDKEGMSEISGNSTESGNCHNRFQHNTLMFLTVLDEDTDSFTRTDDENTKFWSDRGRQKRRHNAFSIVVMSAPAVKPALPAAGAQAPKVGSGAPPAAPNNPPPPVAGGGPKVLPVTGSPNRPLAPPNANHATVGAMPLSLVQEHKGGGGLNQQPLPVTRTPEKPKEHPVGAVKPTSNGVEGSPSRPTTTSQQPAPEAKKSEESAMMNHSAEIVAAPSQPQHNPPLTGGTQSSPAKPQPPAVVSTGATNHSNLLGVTNKAEAASVETKAPVAGAATQPAEPPPPPPSVGSTTAPVTTSAQQPQTPAAAVAASAPPAPTPQLPQPPPQQPPAQPQPQAQPVQPPPQQPQPQQQQPPPQPLPPQQQAAPPPQAPPVQKPAPAPAPPAPQPQQATPQPAPQPPAPAPAPPQQQTPPAAAPAQPQPPAVTPPSQEAPAKPAVSAPEPTKTRTEAPKPEFKVATPPRNSKRKREVKPPAEASTPADKTPASSEQDDRKSSKRVRQQTQPYQSPLPELTYIAKFKTLMKSSDDKKSPDDKLIVFYKNEFLAVRNAEGSFYICQAMQNIYKSSPRIRIRWLSQEKKDNKLTDVYIPDFYDATDFDCILTNLELKRLDKNKYQLPEEERERTQSILKRALDVEKGVSEKPPVTDVMDVSLFRDESQLKKRKSLKPKTKEKPVEKKAAERVSERGRDRSLAAKRRNDSTTATTATSAAAAKNAAVKQTVAKHAVAKHAVAKVAEKKATKVLAKPAPKKPEPVVESSIPTRSTKTRSVKVTPSQPKSSPVTRTKERERRGAPPAKGRKKPGKKA